MFRSSSAISENSIVFFEGGHDHDGVSSSLIDTEQYSIYDFTVGKTGSNTRQLRQQRNFDNLKTVVSNIVINDVLGPSGVRLLPNSVQSVHIAAGSVTANELSANVALINNIIRSSNFDGTIAANGVITADGTAGWAITWSGDAVFDSTAIRGSITAASVSTPGVDILSNGTLQANSFTLYGNGAIVTSSGNFSVDASGNLSAQNADITGEINASTGEIGNWSIGATSLSSADGTIFLYSDGTGSSVVVGTGVSDQIVLSSDGDLYSVRNNVQTTINGVADAYYSIRVVDSSTPYTTKISPQLISSVYGGSFSSLAWDGIYSTGEIGMGTGNVNGIGIAYPGCTTGPGTPNYMGLVWDNPDIRGTVDNVVSAVLGTVSDIRFKTNISNIGDEYIDKILNDINIIQYTPIDKLNNDRLGDTRRAGIIAQEIVDIFPDLIDGDYNNPDAYLSVNYAGFVPYLIKTIQYLNDKIKKLEESEK
jgi:hypothetical protein